MQIKRKSGDANRSKLQTLTAGLISEAVERWTALMIGSTLGAKARVCIAVQAERL
jgi:hypothetical protein